MRRLRTWHHRLKSPGLPVDCQVHFAFTLGKAYEDKKDFDQSLPLLRSGKSKTHRDSIAYDPVQTEIAHQKMKESVYGRAFFDQQA